MLGQYDLRQFSVLEFTHGIRDARLIHDFKECLEVFAVFTVRLETDAEVFLGCIDFEQKMGDGQCIDALKKRRKPAPTDLSDIADMEGAGNSVRQRVGHHIIDFAIESLLRWFYARR